MKQSSDPEELEWFGMKLVRVSDVGEAFRVWLYGQTMPMVETNANPFDWAYYDDYERFINHLPVID